MKRRVGNGTAIVTGAASGIGRALADELAKAGVQVVLADRQAELADHAASAIRGGGGVAYATELDVTDLTRFEEVVQVAFSQAGRLDYLFNNAGIGIGGEVCKYDAADWNDVIDVNLRGVAHGILAAYPLMIQQGFGHIVNTASMAGLAPAPLSVSYTRRSMRLWASRERCGSRRGVTESKCQYFALAWYVRRFGTEVGTAVSNQAWTQPTLPSALSDFSCRWSRLNLRGVPFGLSTATGQL